MFIEEGLGAGLGIYIYIYIEISFGDAGPNDCWIVQKSYKNTFKHKD